MRAFGIVALLALLAALWWLLAGSRGARDAAHGARASEFERAPLEPRAQEQRPAAPVVESPARSEEARTPPVVEGTLEPGLDLEVTVSDCSTDRPLTGAHVTCLESAAPPVFRTDANGAATVRVRDSRQPVKVRIEAAGHAHQQVEVSRHFPLEVCLNPTVTLAGRVLAADTHEPVPNARLSLAHVGCDACAPDVVVAGPDGRYELPSVPLLVEVTLTIELDGCEPDEHTFLLRTSEPRLEQDLYFVVGIEIAGRVEDWVSGAPLAGARVAGLVTDEAGLFRGRVLPEIGSRVKSLVVSATGHATLVARCDLEHASELAFRLPRLAAIEGTLSDIAGRPIEGGYASCIVSGPEEGDDGERLTSSPLYELPEGWSFDAPDDPVRSDARGHYRIEQALPWALGVEIYAHARGFESETVAFASLGGPGSVRRVDVALRSATESKIGGVVTLNGVTGDALQGTVAWKSDVRAGQARIENGTYEIVAAPGEVELHFALAEVPGPLAGADAVVRVEAGCRTEHPAHLVAPQGTIDGRVRLEDGTPVAGARVVAMAGRPRGAKGQRLVFGATSDADGLFHLELPDIGTSFDLVLRARQETLGQNGVALGTSGLEFVLGAKHVLFLRALDARTLRPITPDVARFHARESGTVGFAPLEFESAPDASGWSEAWVSAQKLDLLVFPSLESYALELRPHLELGAEPVYAEFRLAPGLDLSIELDSEGPWPARGVQGDPVGANLLLLLPKELWSEVATRKARHGDLVAELQARHTVTFDDHGVAVLHALAPGSYRFRSAMREFVLVPDTLVVDERFTAQVRVRLQAAR